MSKRRTRAELEAQLREVKKTDRIWSVLATIRHGLTVLGFCFVAYCTTRSIESLAGDTTEANIGVNFLANVNVSQTLAWVLGGCGVAYGYAERQLRAKTAKRQGNQIRELEKLVDPSRTTSRYEGG